MNFLFSPYFENISTYYSPCKVLSRNSYGKSDYFNCNFRIRLAAITQFKNDRDELGRVGPERKWRRSLNATKQTWLLSYAFGEVWGFARFISSILSCSMRGRRSVVEDYGKESIDESEISIHSSPTSGYVYFKRKSFVCVHRKVFNPVGHPAVCSLHFTAECFTQAFYEKGTRKYLKPGSVPAIRKKNISNHIWAGSSNGERIFICRLC